MPAALAAAAPLGESSNATASDAWTASDSNASRYSVGRGFAPDKKALEAAVLASYAAYYNQMRTHLALGEDAALGRAVQRSGAGAIVVIPILSGLHHHYVRI